MKNMKKWRFCSKLIAFGMKLAVLAVVLVSWTVVPAVLADCRSLAEWGIVLGVLVALMVCAVVTAWLAVEYDRENDRQWLEYRRRLSRCRGLR